jgi:TDG/mug DNA glycosylase family protein
MKILFVGINPGKRSAEVGHHFAGYSNRFWKLLYESKLIPIPLTHLNDYQLPNWGLGLTNIIARPTSGIKDLTPQDYVRGRKQFRQKIETYHPKIIALLGVTLAPTLFPPSPPSTNKGKKLKPSKFKVGLYDQLYFGSQVFILPNPSGRNAHYSYAEMLRWFHDLHSLLNTYPPQNLPLTFSSTRTLTFINLNQFAPTFNNLNFLH